MDGGPFNLFMRPSVDVCLIDINKYVKQSKHPSAAKLKEETRETHNRNRGVICEPIKKFLFLSFNEKPTPCKFLTNVTGDGVMTHFTKKGTELISARARATFQKFCQYFDEFEELKLPALVKLAYPVDNTPDSHEHLWFEVHRAYSDRVEATLLNEPHDISALKAGMRAEHAVENLSDWIIMCPFGTISPDRLGMARTLRSRISEAREIIKNAAEES